MNINEQELKKYNERVKKLQKWSYHYYTLDEPLTTDEEYDIEYHKLLDFEKKYNYISKHSPSIKVGNKILPEFKEIKHIKKMYSLKDVFNEKEIENWMKQIQKENPNTKFYAEPKYDGVSLNLLYKNGELVSGSSRGNGEYGENITENMKYILGIPSHINYNGIVEIRGEVTLFKNDFIKINEEKYKLGEKEYANERNAASGILRQRDSSKIINKKLRFTPYGIGHCDKHFNYQTDVMKWIKSLGFTSWGTNKIIEINDPIDLYKKMINERDKFPMLLDGMVLKVNNIEIQEKLGSTSKYPKWALACKFPAIEKQAKIVKIINQVGKTGVITPVALITPTEIGGVIVERVTLHNYDEIKRKDIKINDKVSIIRSGDVIPKIQYVFKGTRTGDEIDINLPNQCPSCSGPITKNGVFVECNNNNCQGKKSALLSYSIGKKSLNIKDFGEKFIEQLIEKNLINKLSDIYYLKVEQLIELDRVGEKKAKKIIDAIQNSKNIDLYRFINALGIDNIGETASKLLSDKFKERLLNEKNILTEEELLSVKDIGPTIVKSYLKYFNNEENIKEFKLLKDLIKPVIPKEEKKLSKIFKNKTFVITGTLTKSRDYFKNLIIKNGGKVSGSVSKNTDYLLAGEKSGSKLNKANQLEIKILSEEDFKNLLNNKNKIDFKMEINYN